MRFAAYFSFLLAWQSTLLWSQSSAPLIAINGDVGLLLPAGAQTNLNVVVTDRNGNVLPNQPVLFVAPAAGSTGTFPNAATSDQSYFRAMTDSSGAASAAFVANNTLGVYLVEALVEGTAASVTFAISNVSDPTQPPLTASSVRTAVEQNLLFGTQLDETLRVHGPVLTPPGAVISTAFPSSTQPYTTDRQSWVLWIDEQPGFRFGHRVRFVIVDAADATADLTKARITREQSWPVVRLSTGGVPNPLLPASELNAGPFLMASNAPPQLAAIHPAGIAAVTPGACAILVHGVVKGGADDVVNMQNFLVNSGRVSGATSLTQAGPNGRNAPATRKELAALIQLAADLQCKKVYFYIASHGTQSGSVVLVNGDTGEHDPVSADDLQKMLAPLAGAEICPIIDACYAGKMAPAFQGIGSTGTFVGASDATHTAPGGTDHFTPALIKCWMDPKASSTGDGMVTLDDAKKWVDKNASQTVTGAKPLSLPINPKDKVASIPDVSIDKAGGQGFIVIPRPAGIPLDSRIDGTLSLPDTMTAKLGRFGEKGLPVTFLPGEASTTVLVTGVADGQTHAFFVGKDQTTGLSVSGSALISVGGPYAPVSVPSLIAPNSTKTIQIQRFEGYEQTLRQAILQANSQDPSVAAPDPPLLTFDPYQISTILNIRTTQPGRTSLGLSNEIFVYQGSYVVVVGSLVITGIDPLPKVTTGPVTYTVSGSNLQSVGSALIKIDAATTETPAHNVTPKSFQFDYRFLNPGPIELFASTPPPDKQISNAFDVKVLAPPVINSVNPATFPASILPRTLTITGVNFDGITDAIVSNSNGDTFDYTIHDATPNSATATVTINNSSALWFIDVEGNALESNKFKLNVTQPVPNITSIDPATPGVLGGVQDVTVTGTDFLPGVTLGVAAPDGTATAINGFQIQNVSPTRFDAFVPFNIPGDWRMQAINPGNVPGNIFPFTVIGSVQGPIVTATNPATFTVNNNPVNITIIGSNFQNGCSVALVQPGGMTVTFSASQVQFLDSSHIQIQATLNTPGNGSIMVINPGNRSSSAFPVSIAPAGPTSPLALACPANSGQQNVAYMSALMASGGKPPYSFAIISGSLPQGLMLNAWTGSIGGTPGTAGSATFTAQVVDALGATVKQNCSITVASAGPPAPVVSAVLPPNLTSSPALQPIIVQGNNFVIGQTSVFLGFPGSGGQSFQGSQLQNLTTNSFNLLAPLTTSGNYTITVTAGSRTSNTLSFPVK